MRALILKNGMLTMENNIPVPEPAEKEALIRIFMSGICSTDLELLKGYKGFNGIPGHEFVGIVERIGAHVDQSYMGRRVVGEINCGCTICPSCIAGVPEHCIDRTCLGILNHQGVFAEYAVLPVSNLHFPDTALSDKEAVFTEPLAAALEILERIHVHPSDRVVVVGDGKLGLLIAQVLRLTGCRLTVVGKHHAKLTFLKEKNVSICNEYAFSASRRRVPFADIVVEATGSEKGFAFARQIVRPRGKMVMKTTLQGFNTVDLTSIVVDEITLIGSRCGPFSPALHLLRDKLIDVEPLIDSIFPLKEGEAAFQRAAEPGALKVLIKNL